MKTMNTFKYDFQTHSMILQKQDSKQISFFNPWPTSCIRAISATTLD